jgi:hypothetical protein
MVGAAECLAREWLAMSELRKGNAAETILSQEVADRLGSGVISGTGMLAG